MPHHSLLFGDAALTVACAEILLSRGHRLAVWTGDPRLAAWCAERGVRSRFEPPEARVTAAAVSELAQSGLGGRCDFLWSVHNVRLLPPEVLALPRRLAVNFHDALLPRYAGLHATRWARFAEEREHGITWHHVTPGIDTGEILLQRRFPVVDDDTAWTLNLRAAAAARESFPELLDGILARTIAARAQELERRSYFAGWRQPTPGCVIPWTEAAGRVVAFVRALDFGVADSPLGLPKLLTPGGVLFAAKVERLDGASAQAPGTVVAVEGPAVTVATGDGLVRFPELFAPAGGGVGPALGPEGLALAGVAPRTVLPSAAPDPVALAALLREIRPHERFWTEQLLDLAALVPPELEPVAPAGEGGEHRLETALGDSGASEPALLAALLDALSRSIGEPYDVALGEPDWRRRVVEGGAVGFVAPRLPFRVDRRDGAPIAEFSRRLADGRRELVQRGGYAVDLARRSRRLRERAATAAPAIAVDLGDGPLPPIGDARLAIAIGRGGRIVWRVVGVAAARIAALAEQLTAEAAASLRHLERGGAEPIDSARISAPAPLVPELFRRAARERPDAIALEDEGERTSYGELAARVARLARALRRRGAGGGRDDRERVVAILSDRLSEVVTGILAALEAGAAFLVVDPRDPPARQRELLDEAEPRLVLARPGLAIARPEIPRQPFVLAEHIELPDEPGDLPNARPWTLAYLAFTSGSSGRPKAVAIEHGALAHYVRAAGDFFALGAGDRMLQLGSLSFDLAYEQVFGALCFGATLVGRGASAAVAGAELLASAATLAITVLDLPTIVWERTAESLTRAGTDLPPGVRLATFGGDRASLAAARAWRRAGGDRVRLVNSYGPTEATIVATWWELPGEAALAERATIPIGSPVPGVTAWLLAESGRPVAESESGELWLGGAGLARGYYRRPSATRERFRPVAAAGGARLYRTGDLAVRNAEGELEFRGRLDRQVKIAGARVEPEAIEALLASLDGVAAAAVTAVGGEGGLRLAAWYVPATERGDQARAGELTGRLRAELENRLPTAMRPSSFVAVDRLPRLAASGKIDYRALAASSASGSERRVEGEMPPELARLARLFARAIGVEVRSPSDDFFSLGGDSLGAVSLLASIEEEFGVVLPVDALLRSSTVERLAVEVAERGGRGRASALVRMESGAAASGRPPLYCVHGLGGHLLRLIDLARELAPELPFFGLQSPGLDDAQAIPGTIEELAARFLAEVRRGGSSAASLQLCGMSFGGIVALEMARQARAAGEGPAFVGLFDSEIADLLPRFAPPRPPALKRLQYALRRLVGDRLGRTRRFLRRVRGGRDVVFRPNEYRHFSRVKRANERALLRYELPVYTGRITYFVATARGPEIYEEFVRRTRADLELVPVPGDHLSMLEPPNVSTLARELLKRLA
jgi:amino acid adenylation domain-containing protein